MEQGWAWGTWIAAMGKRKRICLQEHPMSRAIWKGAISFGLVHVPVALYPATQSEGVDFDWLDRRTLDPVGYKRVNKRTGKEIKKEDIVKGVQQAGGDYVVLSDKEVAEAYPRTTQTIEIESFVKAQEVSFVYLERPYYLESINKGDKVYMLLRDAMAKAGVIGIARLVLHTKEHLAALVPAGPALMLDLLRWSDDIRSGDELNIPSKAVKPKDTELKMATQLIEEMTTGWRPDAYKDTFSNAVHKLIEKKVAAGETAHVEPLEEMEAGAASNVIDLAELLRGSLKRRQGGAAKPAKKHATQREAEPAAKAVKKTARKVAKTASKTATTTAARKRA
jgi:DNA end-binding protein Ku